MKVLQLKKQVANEFFKRFPQIAVMINILTCNYVTKLLRVNITIVNEHTVSATSGFSMCMLRVVFNVILF